MIYTVTLNPALDYDVYLTALKKSGINEAEQINFRAGGKGINVSKMLNNLGERSIATGFIGGVLGEFIKKSLDDDGIQNDFVNINSNIRLNIKIKTDDQEEVEIAGLSPNILKSEVELLLSKLNTSAQEDIVVFSGSIPPSLDSEIYKNMIESIKNSPKIVLDTRGDLIEGNISILKGENYLLLKPNIHELEQFFDEKINSDEEIADKAKYFLNYGVQNVLVSKGKQGAVLVTHKNVYSCKAAKGKVVNSVGAGDAMVAGFVSGLLKKDIIHAFKMSVACGSCTAYSLGLADLKNTVKLYEQIQIEQLL